MKGLTQLHDGGRIPVVTVQNTGAKAYDGAFFSFFFFGVAFHIKENKWQGSNGFFRAIVYLKDLAVNVHSVTKPRLPSKIPNILVFLF